MRLFHLRRRKEKLSLKSQGIETPWPSESVSCSLKTAYSSTKYPDRATMMALAQNNNIAFKKVKDWFEYKYVLSPVYGASLICVDVFWRAQQLELKLEVQPQNLNSPVFEVTFRRVLGDHWNLGTPRTSTPTMYRSQLWSKIITSRPHKYALGSTQGILFA